MDIRFAAGSRAFSSLFFVLLFSIPVQTQTQSVPIEHRVYDYLRIAHTAGYLTEYDHIILPLDLKTVRACLDSITARSSSFTETELARLNRFREEFCSPPEFAGSSLCGEDRLSFTHHIKAAYPTHLYFYGDSLFRFSFDFLTTAAIISKKVSDEYRAAALITGGGRFIVNFKNNLAAELSVFNGAVFNDRAAAAEDRYARYSFTFNKTGLNNFDFTKGYVRYADSYLSAYWGREQTTMGFSPLEPAYLGGAHPPFDYLLLRARYKSLRYDFLHGWLVTSPIRLKPEKDEQFDLKISKQISVSRLSVQVTPKLQFGIAQSVIYAGRSFDAAYLNPFLFWESAQRTMNDVDNSFLTLDWEYLPFKGIAHYGNIVFDDIEFNNLLNEGFETKSNRSMWQGGVIISHPLLPSGFSLTFDACMIRPFTYSHPGYLQTLNYTNNGYPLGVDAEPNSILLTAEAQWWAAPALQWKLRYKYYRHGRNVTDSTGAVIRNTGGDIARSYDPSISELNPLFDGTLEQTHTIQVSAHWAFSALLNCSLFLRFAATETGSKTGKESAAGMTFRYNWY